jgi:hypothetical protein
MLSREMSFGSGRIGSRGCSEDDSNCFTPRTSAVLAASRTSQL